MFLLSISLNVASIKLNCFISLNFIKIIAFYKVHRGKEVKIRKVLKFNLLNWAINLVRFKVSVQCWFGKKMFQFLFTKMNHLDQVLVHIFS